MKRPLIGVIGGTGTAMRGGVPVKEFTAHAAYFDRIYQAGGNPVLIPPIPDPSLVTQWIEMCDGFCNTGGYDHLPIDQCYGEALTPEEEKTLDQGDRERQLTELILVRAIVARDVPYLGICRGMQALNVAQGGTLYPDIGSLKLGNALVHTCYDGVDRFMGVHSVMLYTNSKLRCVIGDVQSLRVNSRHHQAVHELGTGITKSGHAVPDGVIEVIEMRKLKFIIGVQWHPEDLDDEPSNRLFRAFIDACES